jgi:hypothetical protein
MALLVIFWFAGGSDATAAIYRIVATPTGTDWSGFEIVWEDTEGEGFTDGYLDQKTDFYWPGSENDPEMQSANSAPPGGFSGVSYLPGPYYFNWLLAAPGAPQTFTTGTAGQWFFYHSMSQNLTAAPGDAWTYTREVVPLPPSVFLLGTGLLGLGLLGRRRKLS